MRSAFIIVSTVLATRAMALTIAPVAGENQVVRYSNGLPTTISPGERCAVIVTAIPNPPKNIALWIGVHNKSSDVANFGVENISAQSNHRPLRIFTYEELVKRANSAAGWQRFAAAMGAGLRAGAASMPSTSNYNGQFNATNPYGQQYSGNYYGQSTTTNPAQQAIAQSAINQDARAQAASIDLQLASRQGELHSILRTTSVYPDKLVGGVVEIDKHGAKDAFLVTVQFNGEKRTFAYRMGR